MGLKRQRVLGMVAILTGSLAVGFPLLMPISGNLVRYLWWRCSDAPNAQSGNVYTGGAAIHYQVYSGQAPAIVLVHGGLSHRLSWFSQLPWLVSSGREIVVVDSRGHGRSGLGEGELSYVRQASDLIAVMDVLHLREADIVGWSDGGNTALVLAHRWPDRVHRIVAISANYDPSGLTEKARSDAARPASTLTHWLDRWWTDAGSRTRELERRIKQMWLSGPMLTPGDLSGIRCPVLVIAGGRDVIRSEHAEAMAALIPGARLALAPDGRHSLPVTDAEWVDQLIREFLLVSQP